MTLGGRPWKECMFQTEMFKEEPPNERRQPREYKVVSLRECPTPERLMQCDQPHLAADYWRLHVATGAQFDAEKECFVILLLTTRRKVKGHCCVSMGTLDTILVHPREVFRPAIIAAAAAIILMHNHPSGDPTPSEADVRVTRELIRAGQLLRLEVLDHVILGMGRDVSLRELGYFYT
jgi:DNA repair protein RadC